MKSEYRKRIIVILVVLLILALPDILVRVMPSRARRCLPENTSDIYEEFDGFICYDYLLLLKAKISEEGFQQFIKKYGLKIKYVASGHDAKLATLLRGKYSQVPEWWNPDNDNLEACYFIYKPEKDHLVIARYQDGFIYFSESKL